LIERLNHRHGGGALQDFSEPAGVIGVEMLHQHKGHAAVGGGVPEELFQGFQTSGGSANADNG
jgi:hypothetical protein